MVTQVNRWHLLAVGCGTANLACARALASSAAAKGLRWVGLVDPSAIRELNAVTCPEYAGHAGRPKVERLAELVRAWCAPPVVAVFHHYLEEVDWRQVFEAGEKSLLLLEHIGFLLIGRFAYPGQGVIIKSA